MLWNCLVYESIETRSTSIESQPKKVVFVVVEVVFVFVVVGGVIIVGHRNLTLKFGPNSNSNKWYVVVVVDQEP